MVNHIDQALWGRSRGEGGEFRERKGEASVGEALNTRVESFKRTIERVTSGQCERPTEVTSIS